MTRKEVAALAAALKNVKQDSDYSTAALEVHEEYCRAVARVLSNSNPRFDMAHFFVAAGAV